MATDDAAHDRPTDESAADARPDRRPPVAVVAIALAVALAIGFVLGDWSARSPAAAHGAVPAADSVDVGFAQDMTVHHGQAVEMSSVALSQAVDPEIRTLAYDVLTTQQSQIGTMQGWLMLWDKSQVSEQPMRWMKKLTTSQTPMSGHAMASDTPARMPGMASTEELATLRRSSGPTLDTLYLQLLLRHHEGGIPMARLALEQAGVDSVRTLARQIVATQSAEAQTLRQMLTQRGAAPLPMS